LNWQPKDNLDSIGSSRAFQALEVNNTAIDCTTPQADAIPSQLELEATTRQEDEVTDASTPVSQVELQTDAQMDKEPEALTFTYENVDTDIQLEKLPSTSVHVLEEISYVEDAIQQENASAGIAALHQQTSFDVMALEHAADVQPKTIETESTSRDEPNEINAIPLRYVSIQHQEVHVSKNVQSDLDLWARIREYDQRMAEEGFTQVLSKKQQQAMKKQVLGKVSYNTRAKGTQPPSQ